MQADYALRTHDPGQVQAALAALAAEITRATRSTQQLLALGRSDTNAIDMAGLDLAALLREVALDLLPQARARRIDLGVHAVPPPFPAVADRQLLREALANLVANAIAYTPEGGTINLLAGGDAAGWSVGVEDNGPGLSEEERGSLGQRFRRGTRAVAGGSGLGLAIARSIAQRHRGVLRLEARGAGPGLHAALWWPRGDT
ncbi:sensor histidine kinase [Xylophilus sp. ASV27]|uniref:sensor histidine kinase n=1 Tax=Xylophilus sp. ASV27 TaxID=2795129 RepID=UPI00351C2493